MCEIYDITLAQVVIDTCTVGNTNLSYVGRVCFCFSFIYFVVAGFFLKLVRVYVFICVYMCVCLKLALKKYMFIQTLKKTINDEIQKQHSKLVSGNFSILAIYSIFFKFLYFYWVFLPPKITRNLALHIAMCNFTH